MLLACCPKESTLPPGKTLQSALVAMSAVMGYCSGEFFEAEAEATPDGILYREFFQQTKDGKGKGLVVLNLKELPA